MLDQNKIEALKILGMTQEEAETALKRAEKPAREKGVKIDEAAIEAALIVMGYDAEASAKAAKQRGISPTMQRYAPQYIKSKGGNSLNCGDKVAGALDGKTYIQVADIADLVCKTEKGYHLKRYAYLNNGQIRMNSGNRVRSAYKLAVENQDKKELERIERLVGMKPY